MKIDKEIGPETGDLYATSPNWRCGNTERQQLGIYVRIENMLEATGDEQFEECPWMTSFELLPHRPSPKGDAFDEDRMGWINEHAGEDVEYRLALMREHLKSYGSGVPMNRQFSGVSVPGKELPTPKGASSDESDGVWVMFENLEDAKAYALAVLEQRAEGLMGLVGFVLDAPVNRMGMSGWDLLGDHLDLEGAED